MIEKKDINKIINQLEFLELLDLIEILLMKNQHLEKSKKRHFLFSQKYTKVQKEMDTTQSENFHIKIEVIVEHLRKFSTYMNLD